MRSEKQYEELAAKFESAAKNATANKGKLINREELKEITLNDGEIATMLELAVKKDDWVTFSFLVLKAEYNIRAEAMIPVSDDGRKPMRSLLSFLRPGPQHTVPSTRYQKPSRQIPWVQILCDMLDRQLDDLNNEDIVETLDTTGDETILPSMRKALNSYPLWPREDEYGNLAVKAVWALERIDSAEAINALKEANANSQILNAPNNDDVIRALTQALAEK